MRKKPINELELRELKDKNPLIRKPLICGLCNDHVRSIDSDIEGIELPFCPNCDIYFVPHWELLPRSGMICFEITPKTVNVKNSQILQTTAKGDVSPIQTLPKSGQSFPEEGEEHTPDTTSEEEPPLLETENPKSVREQIIDILNQEDDIVQTSEFLVEIDASKQAILKALRKLVEDKIVQRVKKGHYRLNKRRKK